MNAPTKSKIKLTLLKTKARRKTQRCLVFELKIDHSKLSNQTKEKLRMYFLEAKWLYNFILGSPDIFKFDYKTTEIKVYDKNKNFVDKTLVTLPAKPRQDILRTIHHNITSLARKKSNRHKVGKLKFKSSCDSIELSQYKDTHSIINSKRIRITGIKQLLHVKGLHQIKPEYEIANAKLLRKPSGYYIKLTCFRFIEPKEIKLHQKEVGIDYGIKTSITTSDGEKFHVSIGETDRLKRLQRKFAKSVLGSNNRFKVRLKTRKEYEKMFNRKKDKSNKIVNYLLTHYDKVYMQDENIKGWHKHWFGKQVQHSCLGLIKEKLRESNQVQIISRWEPTTKLCYNCGKVNNIPLGERTYSCECGLTEDRDIKAAKTILHLGQCKLKYVPVAQKSVPMERRDFKPVENLASSIRNDSKSNSLKQEAHLVE